MENILQTESTLTDRYQTTIPDAIRKALHLNKRDKIIYNIQPNGEVILSKRQGSPNDPVIDNFLEFIANDIQLHPEHLRSINQNLFNRIESLIADVTFELDEPLLDEKEDVTAVNLPSPHP